MARPGAGGYAPTKTTDDRLRKLYDDYCHSTMPRREFLRRAAAIGGLSAVGAATALLPDYASACQVAFTDPRIKATYARFPSPGGNGPELRAYVAHPAAEGTFPAVLVVHENRGLNPYIEDVARRLAVAGFLAVAPDALTAVGGYPGNDEDGKVLQANLDRARILVDMENAARFAKAHPRSTGRLGVVGFCFGAFVSGHLAVTLGDALQAAAPFYGRAPDLAGVERIRARMLLIYAENDEGVNATRAPFEQALRRAGARFESRTFAGTGHGFHNDSTTRYDEKAAAEAWDATIALFREALAGA